MSPLALGHGGWTGTAIWVDPAFNTFVVMLSSRLNINPSAPNIYPTFAKIADRAIDSIRDPHNETAIRSSVRASILSSADEKAKFRFLASRRIGIMTDFKACVSDKTSLVIRMLREKIAVKTVFCRDKESVEFVLTSCRKASLPVPEICKLYELNPRRLLPKQIKGIDTLVFDAVTSGKGNDLTVIDLGRAMQTAADNKLSFVLSDRFNPGGMDHVSGEFTLPGAEPKISFRRLPEHYAMSLGELALMFNSEYRLGLSLSIFPCGETKITVPGTEKNPVIRETISLKGDMPWFGYQRGLYLIYPRK